MYLKIKTSSKLNKVKLKKGSVQQLKRKYSEMRSALKRLLNEGEITKTQIADIL